MSRCRALNLFPILSVVSITMAIQMSTMPIVAANDHLVFISAFAKGKDAAIQAYQLDLKSGELKPSARTTDVEHPFFLAVAPNQKYLYSIHAPGQFGGTTNEQIAAFEILGKTGELKLLNKQSALGTAACYLDVDKTGKSLIVANYSTGSVAALPIRSDGSLAEATTFIQHVGSSVNKSRQEGPHAHCFVVSPDNRFALSADLGLDQVIAYRLDGSTGKLTLNSQPFARTPPGAGPRHLTFHPNGKHVYVINELANSMTVYNYESSSGYLLEQQTISTVPEGFNGTSYCADVKITPDGKFLYGTNRGHDSIAVYRVADDGRLSVVEITASLGKGPQNLAIVPGGDLLLCANMPGNNVAIFRINRQTGALTAVGQPISIPSPSCIMILAAK